MRKKSKIYFFILFLSFFTFPFMCNAQTGHNGWGLFTPGSSVTGKKGLVHELYSGVRLTMVDSDGNKLPGTISADYWSGNNTPQNAEMLSGSSYRTKHINQSGSDLSTGIIAYKANVFDESHIGSASSSSWYNRDNVLHETMMRAIDRTNSKKKCVSTTFFVDMNFKLCDLFEGKCADLKKYYILIEPLLFINVNGHDIVVTGTEYTALIDKLYPSNDDLIYDLRGDKGYGNALLGMFLSKYDKKDSTDYDLKSKGKVYTIPIDTSKKNYSDYDKNIQNNSYRKPYGYSMQIVWLGDLAKDCEPNCCVPCDTTDDGLKKYITEGGICDPYNCEGEDEIATGIDSNGNLVCEPYTPDDCCDPSKENCCIIGTQLCDGSVVDEQYYNLYCSQDNGCKYPIYSPIVQTGVCTTDNSDNKSTFTDGNFSDIIYDYKNLFYQGEIKIYQPENTSTYCETYCQEIISIELPKNYPYANAGRYFTWTISDKDDSLIKETVEKNCATDIKLDKWMNDYRTKITEIDAALSKWNEEGFYSDISGENLAKRRTDLNTELRKCKNDVNNSKDKIKDDMKEEDKNKIENDALKKVEDTGDDKETGIEKRIKEDNKNKADELSNLYSDFNDISKNELEVKCGNQCTVETIFGGFYKITANDLPKDKDSEEYKKLIESEKEKIKQEAIGASIAAEMQSKLIECEKQYDGGYVQTLANAKGDILKEHRNNLGDIDKYTFEGNNPENATLNSLISDLKKCQYNYDENEDTEKSNVKNTLLNLNFLYSTYLSTSEYSNSDIVVTTINSPITSSKGCIQITENEECNPNLIFESSSCRTGKVIVNDKTMYLISSLPGLLNSNKSYNYENLSNYWNSYFFAKSMFENEYKLKNNINACVCKDGTIINANDDGSCECPDMSSKTEIIADISNQYSCYFEWKTTKYYTTISSGNLSVEYMTPTGLYPLSLDYSNIGTNGHFSQLMKDGVLKNVSHCEDGTCHYSDEDGKCYFIVDNEVIIDGGFIEDSICPEGICEPDDKCTGGDCSNFCEVGKCSNDSSVGGMEIIYRQIDLNNPFPDREPGKNWQGNEEIITNNRDVDGNKLYSSNLEPIYSITMTPSTIKEIRKVNNALNYDYSSISTMLFDDNKITGGVSYVLRGNLKDIAERTGGSFTINLNDANTSGRFDDIINNTKVDNSGNLATCREKASEVLK